MFIRQASPASASQALVKLMKQIGMKAPGGDDSHHPPMMLALWDGIGNVHELNGFRGDPASWLDLYVTKERPMQVGALQGIDAAHAIVQSRTDQDLRNQETAVHQATALGRPEAQSALAAQRARELTNATPTRAAQINAYYDDMSWMAANNTPVLYQSRLISFGQSTSAGTASSSVSYTGAYRDQIMNDARAYTQAEPGIRERKLAQMRSYSWSKYEVRLKRQDVEKFRKHYKALQSAVFELQESRSSDVGKWLQAKLFLDTLEDYQSTDLDDAVAFEIVVTDGLAGIGSTPKGKAILDTLVTQWDPLQPGSLIWRVFAMNQKDARQELGQLLKTALAKKDMPLESGQAQTSAGRSAGVDAVISAAGMIGKLNSYYKNLAKLALESNAKKISPLGGVFKRLEVDLFGMTVGDAVFAKFRVNQLGDFVGEKILQTVLLQRAGISYSDALALVRKQAELEKLCREETIERLSKVQSRYRTDPPKSTQGLYEVWNQMKSTEDGVKALRSSRIAVVAALLEAVNFYKLVTAAPDRDTTIKLVQSGASMLSSLITITMTPYYVALKDSVRSQSWKLVGGWLSSFGTFISAWMDGEKASDRYHKQQFDALGIYTVKAFVGLGAGTATLIDATSTAAPLLKKLALRYGTVVVIEAIETATARVVAWAALRAATMLTGWEVTVTMLVLQAMADWFTPTDLESWCSRCAFGTGQEAILRVTDHGVERYTDPSQQEKDFVNAMTKLP
jgi:hypothetical protein